MIKLYHDEVALEMELGTRLKFRYAITNYGRLISFTDEITEGRLLKVGQIGGYNAFCYKATEDGKIINKRLLLKNVVAQLFVEGGDNEKNHVIHLDHNYWNHHYKNLKWVTHEEMLAHAKTNPALIEGRRKVIEHNIKSDGKKLKVTEVIFIKKRLADPNCTIRMKMLAKQFGISEMQLYRIKRGENWGHIKI